MPLILTDAAAGSALILPPKELPNAETGARAGEGSNMSKNGSGSIALVCFADDMKEEEDEKGENREVGLGVVGDGALEVVAEVRFDELGLSYRYAINNS